MRSVEDGASHAAGAKRLGGRVRVTEAMMEASTKLKGRARRGITRAKRAQAGLTQTLTSCLSEICEEREEERKGREGEKQTLADPNNLTDQGTHCPNRAERQAP